MATLFAMHAPIETRRSKSISLARRRGETGLLVFGSMSRSDARENSDVDMLATLSRGTRALALGRLLLDAQDLLSRREEIVTEARLHLALLARVLAADLPP